MDDEQQPAEGEPAAPDFSVPGVSRPSPLAAGLDQIRAALAMLRQAAAVLSDEDCREGVRELAVVDAEVQAVWLSLVADLDGRPQAVPGAAAGRVAQCFLTGGLNHSLGQARRDVDAARAVPLLPRVREAYATGKLRREHVDACAKTLNRLPEKLRAEPAVIAQVDGYLAEQSRVFDAPAVERLGRHLVGVLAPDTGAGFDPERFLKRAFTLHDSPDGMTLGRLQLDETGAAYLRAALTHFGRFGRGLPEQQQDGELSLTARDERSQAQRWCDALVEICRLAMSADPATTRREPAHVLVIATPEQLADAHTRGRTGPTIEHDIRLAAPGLAQVAHCGPVRPATLARLTCDSILQAIVIDPNSGKVLNLGRSQRTATRAQRRALAARDGGCIPPPWHHLARPDGRPVRLALPRAVRRAHELGQQLRLDLSPGELPDTG